MKEETMHINKILVATDFTNCSRKALRTAIAIAENKRAHVYLLHAIELLSENDISQAEKAIEEADIILMRDEIDQLVDEMRKNAYRRVSNDRIHVLEEQGKYEEIILDKAKELDVDLIVMGTHGYGNLKERIAGSSAEYIAKYAHCSVLTVKPEGYPVFTD